MAKEVEKKEEIISTKTRIEVIATGKNKYHKPGQKCMVHPKVAEKGIALGHFEKKGK